MSESTGDTTSNNASEAGWRSSRWSRLFLPLCLATFIALGTAYAFIVPLGQAPDEPAHFRYALFLAENGRLPHFHHDDAGYEAYQAPLYYTLCAAVGKLAMIGAPVHPAGLPAALRASEEDILRRLPDYPTVRDGQHQLALDAIRQAHGFTVAQRRAWRAMRLLNVLIGALGIFLGYRVVFLIFPARPWIAAAVAAFMAALPMYTHICAAVGNDPPTVVAVGLTLLITLLILRDGPTLRRCALLGLALALGMLTKASANAVLPVALLGVAWAAGRRREPQPAQTYLTDWARRVWVIDWARTFRCIGAALGVAAVLAGWWYARSMLLYDAVSHFPANVESQVPWAAYLVRPDLIGRVLGLAIPMTFRNFWAGFAWTNIALAPWAYWLLLAVSAAALPGLILLVADASADRLDWSRLQVRGAWLLILAKALLGMAIMWYILTIDLGGGSQGRYMFPALPAMGMLWTLGVARLLPARARRGLPAAIGAAMLAFNLYCLFGLIIPFYRALGV